MFDNIASPVSAGTPTAVRVRATDQSGNTVPNYNGDALLIPNTGPGSITPRADHVRERRVDGKRHVQGRRRPGERHLLGLFVTASPGHEQLDRRQSGTVHGPPGPPARRNARRGHGHRQHRHAVQPERRLPLQRDRARRRPVLEPRSERQRPHRPGLERRVRADACDDAARERAGARRRSVQPSPARSASGRATRTTRVLFPTRRLRSRWSAARSRACSSWRPANRPAPGTASGRTGTATDQSINYSFNVTVLATDQWWNPVGGVNDVVHLTSNDPLAQLPPDAADGRTASSRCRVRLVDRRLPADHGLGRHELVEDRQHHAGARRSRAASISRPRRTRPRCARVRRSRSRSR